ncbi:MAG TPA: sigma-70 family RNA polymerase sigma factor [Flavilitoribacter sp.]|nr:sigma-70 family RNA polymerase sigma factor [Flavilitoribacter sp.]
MQYLRPTEPVLLHTEGLSKKNVKSCKTDNTLQISALYREYAGMVFQKCVSMLNDPVLAEDAVQEIFTKIFLNLEGFRHDAKHSSWIFSITSNYCIDLIRKSKRQAAKLSRTLEAAQLLTDEAASEPLPEMDMAQLKKIMESISDDDKDLLVMKYQEDLPIREIAARLDKSESAVKMQLMRARNRARKLHFAMAS